jgi:hypothetical protein
VSRRPSLIVGFDARLDREDKAVIFPRWDTIQILVAEHLLSVAFLLLFIPYLQGASCMAGRAATAVKSKTKSKVQSSAKANSPSKTTEKASAVASPARTRRRTKVETRTRIYWAVFNEDLKRVAVFEFDQKIEAEKRAARLIDSSGNHHFIQKIKATVQA